MIVKKIKSADNLISFGVNLATEDIRSIKNRSVAKLSANLKVAGFRPGKIPAAVAEKNIDQRLLANEVLEEAIEQFYRLAVKELDIRPIDKPAISVKKFVPFDMVEFEAEVSILGPIKLPDYKKIKLPRTPVKITDKDITEVIENLRTRIAEKKQVTRAAKLGDQIWIDFRGTDAKGDPIKGADGKDYPLNLGSKTFIPGFEENLIGLKAGDKKEFELNFPKDYGVKALSGKKVKFAVSVNKLEEVVKPEIDDKFAAKAGPFKKLEDLKADIKDQLTQERQYQADREHDVALLKLITEKTKLVVPQILIADQVEQDIVELKKNLTYRGQTYQEYLESMQTTEDKYRKEVLESAAESKVKASIVLSEIADLEQLVVTPDEFNQRVEAIKEQYKDPGTLEELSKPTAQRQIVSRILSEKTIAKLVNYTS